MTSDFEKHVVGGFFDAEVGVNPDLVGCVVELFDRQERNRKGAEGQKATNSRFVEACQRVLDLLLRKRAVHDTEDERTLELVAQVRFANVARLDREERCKDDLRVGW